MMIGPLRLGIDTGGTFTDAALVNSAGELVASAKSPTTHDNLINGILGALAGVLAGSEDAAWKSADIAVVSLSTTLATNAMVERTGSGAALLLVGFDDASAARVGGSDRASLVARIDGGHEAQGKEQTPLDSNQLTAAMDDFARAHVEAIAVAGMFAVRNNAHEVAVRKAISSHPRLRDVPVTCTHDLTGRLNGPRRAATALANALLTTPVARLLTAFEEGVRSVGIAAPLVVVRSDGSVMSLTHARQRPVETILSGPAASLLGGIHLAGVDSAVVVDIGGTTTDVAVVSERVPELSEDGAAVGGTPTMVRSPRITTEGLGGDSEVAWRDRENHLSLGPGRVIPLSVAAVRFPEIVPILMEQGVRRPLIDTDGLFVLTPDGELRAATIAFPTRRDLLSGRRDVAEGKLRLVGLTPTDAAIVVEPSAAESLEIAVSTDAALAGLTVFARCLTRFGAERYPNPDDAALAIIDLVRERSGHIVAAAAGVSETVWNAARGTDRSQLVRIGLALDRPIVGIGASSFLYHPGLAAMFQTEVLIPRGSEVANAVGAAVGSVHMQDVAIITQPKRSGYVLHRPGEVTVFDLLADAEGEGERRLRKGLLERHLTSGLPSGSISEDAVEIETHRKSVAIDGAEFFVESRIEGTLRTDPGGVSQRNSNAGTG